MSLVLTVTVPHLPAFIPLSKTTQKKKMVLVGQRTLDRNIQTEKHEEMSPLSYILSFSREEFHLAGGIKPVQVSD
jgi:hypothetical protein